MGLQEYEQDKKLSGYANDSIEDFALNRTQLRKKSAENIRRRFDSYKDQGHLVLSATLSTLVTSDTFAQSERFAQMWNKFFLEKLHKRLPKLVRGHLIDHEYVIERSPDSYFHFHGLVAVHRSHVDRFWSSGVLNRHLANDLFSFREQGPYRPCCINSFLIEPVENTAAWTTYITKHSDSILSVV
jgi:hypothetical protein